MSNELNVPDVLKQLDDVIARVGKLERLCIGEDRVDVRPLATGDYMVQALAYPLSFTYPDHIFIQFTGDQLVAAKEACHDAFARSQSSALDTLTTLLNAGWWLVDSFLLGNNRHWIVAGPKDGLLQDVEVIGFDVVIQPPEVVDATARLIQGDPFAWVDDPAQLQAAIDDALAKGWIEATGTDAQGNPAYSITPAGRTHIEALVAIPMPESRATITEGAS